MIRRPPTAIQVTAEDVLAYDDEKMKEKRSLAGHGAEHTSRASNVSSELTSSSKHASKESRIGINNVLRGAGSGN
ncbi:anaphase-promoting complex subunit Hcn1 [Schizosaccharomyces japonicus yFS275]|uniref:Anaphase-promoting complex subunit Hcn1 n=1 Tax=Schizosaccharomyces japonicus (strain yFS275 / FY16936) TaxID=402676 RepID=B6JYX9_SCHJY|nr:anaphase-promoting complex subunit Hcn1 [Schizosaccharomyces japonicus yFS275]EEB06747.1 anaphase-promoting complex subunit Hcn1 [Schizosaccharomyces japonicus yFS275]